MSKRIIKLKRNLEDVQLTLIKQQETLAEFANGKDDSRE